MDISEKYFVEYSVDQGCFHVDPISVTVEKNFRAVMRGQRSTYVPIGIADSIEQAHSLAEGYRKLIDILEV